MELAKILQRIDERLKALKLSADGVSRAAGKPDAIRNMKRAVKAKDPGRRGVNVETLRAIAPILEVSVGWLLSGADSELGPAPIVNQNDPLPVDITTLPILGVVEAGAWREIYPEEESRPEVALVEKDRRFPEAKQFLLRVRGDSMNAAEPQPFTEGALVHCIAWPDTGMRLRTGLIVVVRRWNGAIAETTLKRVHEFPDRYELRAESTNPSHKPIIIERDRDDHAEITDVVALVVGVSYKFDF